MELFFQFIILGVGLILLWKTGEVSVRNALGLSSIFGIHQFSVGFFIFAISTGLPEISSAIVSSLKKVPELSVGDLMGSTFVNISLVLGIIAILAKEMKVSLALRKKLLIVIVLIALILIGFAFFNTGHVFKAILLIVVYLGSLFLFRGGLPKQETEKEIKDIEQLVEKIEKKAKISPKIDILIKLVVSLGLLLLSSWITVHSAINISNLLKINPALIGGTMIAVGTSFPELVLDIHAIKRKEFSLALGDLFGSSLLNITFILGMLMLINPTVNLSFVMKILPFTLAALLWVTIAFFRKQKITRKDGYFLLAIFLGYIGWNVGAHFFMR